MTDFVCGRAEAVARRTYCRPLDEAGTHFESWSQVAARSAGHSEKLWGLAGGDPDAYECDELYKLINERKGLLAGRTLWLGGTPYAYSRAASQFNCSYLRLATVYDVVDAAWLLLNGCGVGGRPVVGTLHGYLSPIRSLDTIPSTRSKDYKGRKENLETIEDGKWTISIGDSAEAWAKAIGKLLNPPTGRVVSLILDFSDVRGAGNRLKGYGWVCNGYKPLAEAMSSIHGILNNKAGNILDEIDILDIFNYIGTVLSSRRSAEIALCDYGSPRWREFADAKIAYYESGNHHRRQSNNSLVFWTQPHISVLRELLQTSLSNGDPGFVNGEAASIRAPWFDGVNPCAEILLPSRGFCNLVTACLPAFGRNRAALERAVYILSRANYRQTCVNLQDGILSPEWDQTNQSLRLCGVSLTGIAQANWMTDYDIRRLRDTAICGANSMASELRLPQSKAITTIKPEGTSSKVLGCSEGIHLPLGRYIFNWINYSKSDPIVDLHRIAGYKILDNPYETDNALICFPVTYPGVPLVNNESAVSQLERYKRWLSLWADHNVSCTISMSPSEIDEVAAWLSNNWDHYVAVSFLPRITNLTAAEAGHAYLPQEVVSKSLYDDYVRTLSPVDYSSLSGIFDLTSSDCAAGVCPVR